MSQPASLQVKMLALELSDGNEFMSAGRGPWLLRIAAAKIAQISGDAVRENHFAEIFSGAMHINIVSQQ